MPEQNDERFLTLNKLHEAFCLELDKPGTGEGKRAALQDIADRMLANEPDAYWQDQISLMLRLSHRVFDVAENSFDTKVYDAAKSRLMSSLSGLHMHISSIRPREY